MKRGVPPATIRAMRTPLAPPLLFLTLLAACGTPVSRRSLDELYAELRAEESVSPEERDQRIARVHELLKAPRSSEERLQAAALLLDSTDPADLAVASEQALRAAQDGDDRGFPLAAEAIDRELLLQGLPQRYGTQYVFSPATGHWYLYDWDPTTTDAERQAMGTPTLAEALGRLKLLNAEE